MEELASPTVYRSDSHFFPSTGTRDSKGIFSAPVALSSTDLSSLDGRTTTGGEAARERMRGLLDQAAAPPP